MKTVQFDVDPNLYESFSIEEVGFKLNQEHRRKMREQLISLESRAPAMSFIKLKFTLRGHKLIGELGIYSGGKRFYFQHQGGSPLEIYNVLQTNIDKEILRWKKNRFQSHYHKQPKRNGLNQMNQGVAI